MKEKKQPTAYATVMTLLACVALAAPGWGMVGLSLLGGQLSFGVYLLHNAGQELSGLWWPGLAGWPRVMAAAALTLVAAWLLHHAVEAPARAWGRRWKGATVGQGALAASSGPHSSDQ